MHRHLTTEIKALRSFGVFDLYLDMLQIQPTRSSGGGSFTFSKKFGCFIVTVILNHISKGDQDCCQIGTAIMYQ